MIRWPWRRKRQTVEIPRVGPDEVMLLTCARSLTSREADRLQQLFSEAYRNRSSSAAIIVDLPITVAAIVKRSAVDPGPIA